MNFRSSSISGRASYTAPSGRSADASLYSLNWKGSRCYRQRHNVKGHISKIIILSWCKQQSAINSKDVKILRLGLKGSTPSQRGRKLLVGEMLYLAEEEVLYRIHDCGGGCKISSNNNLLEHFGQGVDARYESHFVVRVSCSRSWQRWFCCLLVHWNCNSLSVPCFIVRNYSHQAEDPTLSRCLYLFLK